MSSRARAASSKSPTSQLARLRAIAAEFGAGHGPEKAALVERLGGAKLPTARAVSELHELLCFLRAYPDDADVLAQVEAALGRFEARADLRRFRAELDDSGIAGTDIYYTFFADTARWLATRYPDRLTIAWDYLQDDSRLGARLDMLATHAEKAGLEDYDLGVRGWIERLKGPGETDAAYVLERWWRQPMSPETRQALYEEMQLLLKLAGGPGGPSRTTAKAPGFPRHFQTEPLVRSRPDLLAASTEQPARVRAVSVAEGERLVALARDAMVTRSRDLDVFCYGDPRDVRVVELDQGLAFVAIGMQPARRLLLESVYGFLTMKNGVPIGYVLAAALHESAEMAYNVFEPWRGHEAAKVYGRALATASHLLGAKAFSAPPYQLGHDNKEGLESGAFWFYQKLGFAPRDPAVARLVARELAAMRRDPSHRSSIDTLQELSSADAFLQRGAPRDDVMGVFPLGAVSLAVTDALARRFGADRERGLAVCAEEAQATLSVKGLTGWTADERLAFTRWAPLVGILPGLDRWAPADRRALADVVRKKGGRYESDFVRAYDAHRPLRRAIARLARAAAK